MRFLLRSSFILLAAAVAGCSTSGSGSGSVMGAFASSGSRDADRPVAGAIVDAMAGGLIGAELGAALGQRERRQALEAEYRALEYTPVGEVVSWGRIGDEMRGEVAAGSPYRVGSQDCRQYTHTMYFSGQEREVRGTACRNEDGSWTPLV